MLKRVSPNFWGGALGAGILWIPPFGSPPFFIYFFGMTSGPPGPNVLGTRAPTAPPLMRYNLFYKKEYSLRFQFVFNKKARRKT